jgi:hypothetical protein
LRDRRRCQGHIGELGEGGAWLRSELLADDGVNLGCGQRGHRVLQGRQLGDERRRQQVGTCRHHLPELDERRPELLNRQQDAPLDRLVFERPGAFEQLCRQPAFLQLQRLHEGAEPVAHEDGEDITQAGGVAEDDLPGANVVVHTAQRSRHRRA